MAGLAGDHPFTAVIEWEGVKFQTSRCPGSGAVAVFTLHTKNARMNRRLFMAGSTCRRRSGKLLICMTGHTFDFGMVPIEGKELCVVEIVHPINAIVTGQAVGAKLLFMGSHEEGIGLRVAGGTYVEVNLSQIRLVTGGALENSPGKICLMIGEGKACLAVVERSTPQRRRSPSVRGMTGLALGIKQTSMNSRFSVTCDTLGGEFGKLMIGVTIHTLCISVLPF